MKQDYKSKIYSHDNKKYNVKLRNDPIDLKYRSKEIWFMHLILFDYVIQLDSLAPVIDFLRKKKKILLF